MNKNTLHQIFQSYIDKFDYFNSEPHIEYYKWQICHEFPLLMKKALVAPDDEFAPALYEVKKCSCNIIDSYTTPFGGLVEFARNDPETVRKMLINFYSDDGGDIKLREKKIEDFFKCSYELLNKYYPDSYLFKQNSHSVSSYLFLNDPDSHYMYKASHCKTFAECIEFYTDWSTGDNIKLDVFHKMCDEVLEEIKSFPELLNTDQSRFDGRLKLQPGELHKDVKKHILLFDIIYCSSAYNLFNGISFKKRNTKEKNLYIANKEKANEVLISYNKAKKDLDLLDEALEYFISACHKGDSIRHKKYGEGIIQRIDRQYIVVSFLEKKVQLSLPISLANGVITLEIPDFSIKIDKYRDVLKRNDSIQKLKEYYSRELDKYEEYIDIPDN